MKPRPQGSTSQLTSKVAEAGAAWAAGRRTSAARGWGAQALRVASTRGARQKAAKRIRGGVRLWRFGERVCWTQVSADATGACDLDNLDVASAEPLQGP